MGCYISRQVQVVVSEELRAEEAILDGSPRKGWNARSCGTPISTGASLSENCPQSGQLQNSQAVSILATVDKEGPPEEEERQREGNTTNPPPQAQRSSQPIAPNNLQIPDHRSSRPKTACCGRNCQVSTSRLCCEHDFTRPLERYCQLCRERYEEWQQANQAFEALVQEMEQTQQDSGENLYSKVSSHSLGSQSWEEHPINDYEGDEYSYDMICTHATCPAHRCSSWEANRVLPCGHTVRQTHRNMLDPCPVCRNRKNLWNKGETEVELGNLGTQTGRFQFKSNTVFRGSEKQLEGGREESSCPQMESKAVWSTEKRKSVWSSGKKRGLFVSQSRSESVSTLSLGDSSTGSMRSF